MIARIAPLFALSLIGCGAAPTDVPADDGVDHVYETAEAQVTPPEAAAPDASADKSGASGASGGAGAARSVTFASAVKERRYGVPIANGHQQPRVIYSIRLPSLSAKEHLRLRGEVSLSRCNRKDVLGLSGDSKTTPCDAAKLKDDPYDYDPSFDAVFVLGDSPNDAEGRKLGDWTGHLCTEAEHHCAVALPEVEAAGLPDAAEKYLNLVVAADAPGSRARSFDAMEVEQSKGGLYVTRFADGAATSANEKTEHLLSTGKLGVDQTEDEGDHTQVRRLLYQVKLEGLAAGDVVDAQGHIQVQLQMSSGCDPLVTGQLILGKTPNDHDVPAGFELTAKNGRNCVDHGAAGCTYEKSGAIQITKGMPSTLYVSYVGMALRSCAAPGGADKWSIDDGVLRVGVTRAR